MVNLLDPNFFLQRSQQSTASDTLGALAAGLLSGRDIGEGLSRGLLNVQGVRQQNRQAQQQNLRTALQVALANRSFQASQAARGAAAARAERARADAAAARKFQQDLQTQQFELTKRNIESQIAAREAALNAPPPQTGFVNMVNPQTNQVISVPKTDQAQGAAAQQGFVISGSVSPEGPGGEFTTKQKNDAVRADSSFKSLSQEIDNFENLIEKTGISILPGKDRDAIVQARTNIQLQMKELFNLGVLNGPDLELMERLIFDPTSASAIGTSLGGDAALQDRAKSSLRDLKAALTRIRNATAGPVLGDLPDPKGDRQKTRRRRFNAQTGQLEPISP
jgi:hypothetical protein